MVEGQGRVSRQAEGQKLGERNGVLAWNSGLHSLVVETEGFFLNIQTSVPHRNKQNSCLRFCILPGTRYSA